MTNTTGVWVLVHPERLGRCELWWKADLRWVFRSNRYWRL
jgi:hypothetical protein